MYCHDSFDNEASVFNQKKLAAMKSTLLGVFIPMVQGP